MATNTRIREDNNAAHKKLPRLPTGATISKRPLLRSHIPSPYAGPKNQKVVYVSTKTPFMSAVKRVRKLLDHINNRAVQSELSRQQKSRGKKQPPALKTSVSPAAEPVVIKATGKAIDKALNLALFLQGQSDLNVEIKTGTVSAIDDIEIHKDPIAGLKSHLLDLNQQGGDLETQDVTMAGTKESDTPLDVEELPSSRIRNTSCIEIFVSLR